MNAVVASRQGEIVQGSDTAQTLHLISVVEGQIIRARTALLANEPQQLLDAMLRADQSFNQLMDRTVLAVQL